MMVSQLRRSLVWRVVSRLKELLRWLQKGVEDRLVRQILLRAPNVGNKHPPGAHSWSAALEGFHRVIAVSVEIIHVPGGFRPLLHFQSVT